MGEDVCGLKGESKVLFLKMEVSPQAVGLVRMIRSKM